MKMGVRRFKLIMLPLCLVCLALSIYMLLHSIAGSQLVGCGSGSGCDDVMGSPWAYLAGRIPVSGFAVMTYLVLLACILFLSPELSGSSGSTEPDEPPADSLDKIIWTIMLVFGGAIVGAALWFCYLQAFVLHSFCKYCTLDHVLGCCAAAFIYAKAPGDSLRPGRRASMVIGVGLAAGFAAFRSAARPSMVYGEGAGSAALPWLGAEEKPSVGQAEPDNEIVLLFDFQCNHCRRLHKLLPEVVEKTGIRFQLCPISLSSECNPYVPRGGVDRFAGSCTMTSLALAVWFQYPEKYPEAEEYLLGSGDDKIILDPDEAYSHIASIVGAENLERALSDERIPGYLSRAYELFGRTSTSQKSGIPRLIHDQKWLVPETDSADELISVIYSTLLN